MIRKFLHYRSQNNTTDNAATTDMELSDEQLKHVSGGYILNTPQGELDWQKRLQYQHTHPGVAIPF